MTRVLLVRHGKASDHWHDYDRLSPSGFTQAEHLATRLLEEAQPIGAAYHGKMRRQRETAETVQRAYADAGQPFPELRELSGLDEMAPAMIDAAMATEPDLALRERVLAWSSGKQKGSLETQHFMMSAFNRFARDEIEGDFEKFPAFRARVVATLEGMLDPERGTVLAFTSGGFIAVATGLAVEAPRERTMPFMANLDNGSVTELRHSSKAERFSLIRLNDAGHLPVSLRTLL